MTKKIIIADDEKDIREELAELIQMDYPSVEIEQVDDGQSLVEGVRTGVYSLVITDNHMLLTKGVEAVRQIREYNANIPIYLMSSDQNIAGQALRAGATDFIYKGRLWEELEPVLKKHLG